MMRIFVVRYLWVGCVVALMSCHFAYSAEEGAPTSATDISGNIRSFIRNLGKGIQINPNRVVVAKGYLPGRGEGVCYAGEKFLVVVQPETSGRVGGRIQVALLPCDVLISNGTFRRLGADQTAATGGATPVAPAQQNASEEARRTAAPQAASNSAERRNARPNSAGQGANAPMYSGPVMVASKKDAEQLPCTKIWRDRYALAEKDGLDVRNFGDRLVLTYTYLRVPPCADNYPEQFLQNRYREVLRNSPRYIPGTPYDRSKIGMVENLQPPRELLPHDEGGEGIILAFLLFGLASPTGNSCHWQCEDECPKSSLFGNSGRDLCRSMCLSRCTKQ